MRQEASFEIGFFVVSSLVLATVATGTLLWFFWVIGKRKWNLCGDRSTELITRLPQPFPRWSIADFILMFGLMILGGSILAQWAASDSIQEGGSESNPMEAVQTLADQNATNSSAEKAPLGPGDAISTDSEPGASPVRATKTAEAPLINQVRIHFIVNVSLLLVMLLHLRVVKGHRFLI